MRLRIPRVAAGAAAVVLGAGLVSAVASPTAAQAPEQPGSAVTVLLNPSYQHPEFEGWGTSLVWMANATGGYPDEIREQLVDMVFGEDGLNLNIARYNIGGGNAPDVRKDYMKVGATMEGFWAAPEGTTVDDRDWWDPANPDHWDWDADANQRWWVDQIKDTVTHWEAFSNSPPYFQTVSGYVSGGFNSSQDQIRTDALDEFAVYLVRVMEHLEDAHGIEFATVNPLNEPNTPYWGTTLGPDGQPTGGRQEGAHAGPGLQQQIILALHDELQGADTDAVISAMDETNPGTFVTNWNAYSPAARDAVEQMNVHTYGTGQRPSVRDLAKGDDKPLWMSEVEGSFHSPTDYTTMETGLGIAARIVGDIRELEPSAWVFWQPVEDTIPQQAGNGNWGSIHVPFNCTGEDTLETCPIQVNTKFHTIRNFTHHIRPGDRFIGVNDVNSVAALKASGTAAAVVHVNTSLQTRAVTLDLSGFATVAPGATVTPVFTSADGALVEGDPVAVDGTSATVVVPAKSVTTLLVDGVAGVAPDAALGQPGHAYRFTGVQSGRSIAPSADGDGIVIRTEDADSVEQLWTIDKRTDGDTNRERYTIVNAASGSRLAVADGLAVLESAGDQPSPAAEWMLSTTGDGTYTFVNVGTGRLLDVWGNATADGSPVQTYTPTSGTNQRWRVTDETALGTEAVSTYTVPGLEPELPETVAAVYRDGARGELPVSWSLPPASAWETPGSVTVAGAAVDALGRTLDAAAEVAVDVFAVTEPARTKTYVGGVPALPDTVVGLGDNGTRVELPVVSWGSAPTGAYDAPGTVTLLGEAEVVDGSRIPATLRVQVTEPVAVNAALEDGVVASATFTEPGYSADRLRNNDVSDKAWSNWRSGEKNPSDTITFTLPAERDVTRVVTYFYRDGNNLSFAESMKVQVLGADGEWQDVSDSIAVGTDGSPVIDVVVDSERTSAVRVVMQARPAGYITLSEIEVFAKAPGVGVDAAAEAIAVDGVPVAGFDPGTTSYKVKTRNPADAAVTVTARDPYAEVAVARSGPHGKNVTVTVTSEGGADSRTYTLKLNRGK
jgi:O-glycosyl hydrolase